jgi:hypothetical protein
MCRSLALNVAQIKVTVLNIPTKMHSRPLTTDGVHCAAFREAQATP